MSPNKKGPPQEFRQIIAGQEFLQLHYDESKLIELFKVEANGAASKLHVFENDDPKRNISNTQEWLEKKYGDLE